MNFSKIKKLSGRSDYNELVAIGEEDSEEVQFRKEVMNLSGYNEDDYDTFKFYEPHLHAASEEYAHLEGCRVDQKLFVLDRILKVKKIYEVDISVFQVLVLSRICCPREHLH